MVAAQWLAAIHSGGSQSLANAHLDADTRDPYLVSRLKLVPAQAFLVYRMDPHVVVLRPSTMGRRFVGFSSSGAGLDFYSCPSGIRRVVLDTRSNRHRSLGAIRALSQQQKIAQKADLTANPQAA